MGSANAAVLPVPVWALPMTSRARKRMSGMARSWMGELLAQDGGNLEWEPALVFPHTAQQAG
jgi:hypothetical protein